MAAADYIQVAQQLYLSYFGRPADYYGLADMTAQLDAAGAPKDIGSFASAYNTNSTVKGIMDNFGTSAESESLYGNSSVSNPVFINAVYLQVLGRAPDLAGLNFWVNALKNGDMTRASAAVQIMAAATKVDADPTDSLTANNKITVATNFTNAINEASEVIGYSGDAAAAAARALLAGVTSTTDTAAYQTSVDATLDQLAHPPVPVVNVSMTTNVDVLTGSTGNDNFNGTLSFSAGAVANTSTLNDGDIVNGGVGTDSLVITVSGAELVAGGTTITPTLTNVEKVLVGNSESDAGAADNVTVNLSLADSSLTTVGTTSSTTVNSDTIFSGITKVVDVVMAGQGDLTVGFDTSSVATGIADALKVTANGVGNSTANATFDTDNGFETLNVTSATSSNYLTLGTISNLATVNVDGAKDISLNVNGAANTLLTTIDASAATGKVTVNAAGLTLADITVKGGTGTTDVFATDKNITASTALKNITGFETLALNAAGGAQTASLDAAVAGVSTFDLSAADKQALTLATGYTGATTVKVGSSGAVDSVVNTANVALTVSGSAAAFQAITVTGGTGTDTLAITADGTATVSLANTVRVETITIAANAVDATKVADFTVGGVDTVVASGKTLSIDAAALSGGDATLTFVGTGETNGHFSVTGGAGADSITGGNGGDTIVSGAGADSITAGTGADSINAGAGNDTINMGTSLTSADTIDGGDGTSDTLLLDSFTAGSMANVKNVEIVKFSSAATSITLAAPVSTAAVTLDLSTDTAQALVLDTGYTGATTVKIGGTTDDSISNVAAVALTVTGSATAFDGFDLTNATGTETLKISANGTASVDLSGVLTGVESIVVSANSTTPANTIALTGVVGAAAGKTTTIDASALTDSAATFGLTAGTAVANSGMSITGAANAINTITWTSSAANTTVVGGAAADSLTAGSGIDSINGGAGNDTINMGTAALTFDDTINGGDGTDTLIWAGTGTLGAAGEFAHVSNVEVLKLTGTNGTASVGSSTPAFTTFDLTTASAQTLTINPGFASAVAVKITADGGAHDVITNTASVALTVTGNVADFNSTTITGGTGTDTLNATANNDVASIIATGIEQINIKAGTVGTEDATISAVAASGKTLTVDASALTDTGAAMSFNGSGTGANGKLVVTGGAGADTVFGGAGNDTISSAAGADFIDSGAGLDVITTGAGADVVMMNTNTSTLAFSTVKDFAAGDAVAFATGTVESFTDTAITLSSAATLSDYINAASVDTTADGDALIKWFNFGGNTYVVVDRSNNGTFLAGTDTVIELQGVLDLSDATLDTTNNTLTFADTATSTTVAGGSFIGDGSDSFTGTAAADTFMFTQGQLAAATVTGAGATDTVYVTAASTAIVDADFTNFLTTETLKLTGVSSAVLGTEADAAGLVNVTTGTGATSITTATSRTTTIDAALLADGAALTLVNSAGTGNFTVTGLQGDLSVNDNVAGNVAVTLAAVATSTVAFGTNTTGTHSVNADALTAGQILTLTGTDAASVSLVAGDLAASGYVTGALSVTATTGANTIVTGAGADTVLAGAAADTITGGAGVDNLSGEAGADLFIIASATDGGVAEAYDGGADTDTLRVTGTTALNLSDDTLTSIDALDLTTDTGVQTLTLTAAQRTAITTINADATDIISLTTLTGATVASTGAIDKFVFGATDVNTVISSFTSGTDKLDVNALTGETAFTTVTGVLTDASKFYLLTGQAAGAADSLAAAAAAITAGATWTSASTTSFVVVVDTNSSSIYQWIDAGTDGAQTAELTLVGSIASTTVAGDYLFA